DAQADARNIRGDMREARALDKGYADLINRQSMAEDTLREQLIPIKAKLIEMSKTVLDFAQVFASMAGEAKVVLDVIAAAVGESARIATAGQSTKLIAAVRALAEAQRKGRELEEERQGQIGMGDIRGFEAFLDGILAGPAVPGNPPRGAGAVPG